MGVSTLIVIGILITVTHVWSTICLPSLGSLLEDRKGHHHGQQERGNKNVRLSHQEIVTRVEEAEFRERAIKVRICPDCGRNLARICFGQLECSFCGKMHTEIPTLVEQK